MYQGSISKRPLCRAEPRSQLLLGSPRYVGAEYLLCARRGGLQFGEEGNSQEGP